MIQEGGTEYRAEEAVNQLDLSGKLGYDVHLLRVGFVV
jgi:hypothetical protein